MGCEAFLYAGTSVDIDTCQSQGFRPDMLLNIVGGFQTGPVRHWLCISSSHTSSSTNLGELFGWQ
jgi:hypothetical protein